ncbi:MAG: IclR family transcriptional regulator [Alphaproteobacteria bacterium]
MSSLERLLSVLDVFSEEKPIWTIEDVAAALGYPKSTVYRYVKELRDSRLLLSVGRSGYILGPRIIELDRQIQACDPLLTIGQRTLPGLARAAGEGVVLLCSLYGDAVLCVDSWADRSNLSVSYTRGRPMPLFRGSASKVILAHLPSRRLTKLFAQYAPMIGEAGLGDSLAAFKRNLQAIRDKPFYVTGSEIDKGVFAVSAPIFSDSRILASLTFAMPEKRRSARTVAKVADLVVGHARDIGAAVSRLVAKQDAGTRA